LHRKDDLEQSIGLIARPFAQFMLTMSLKLNEIVALLLLGYSPESNSNLTLCVETDRVVYGLGICSRQYLAYIALGLGNLLRN